MEERPNISIPVAIVLAGLLIAGAVYFTRSGPGPVAGKTYGTSEKGIKMEPVTAADHILGNPKAPVVVVEYSDLECPFCKLFHSTLHQVLDAYGTDGQVAWVFRHFPLAELHSKAPKEAEAAECAAELGGNDAFWKFVDGVFNVTPSNDGLDPAQLPQIAKNIGLNTDAFNTCLSSGKYADKVQKSYEQALATAESATSDTTAIGTPFTVIVSGSQYVPIEGAQSYASLKSVIDGFLAAPASAQAVPALTPSAAQ